MMRGLSDVMYDFVRGEALRISLPRCRGRWVLQSKTRMRWNYRSKSQIARKKTAVINFL